MYSLLVIVLPDPWVGKIPWRRKWHLTPVFLPGESHGQRSLAAYSPWGHKVSDMTWLSRLNKSAFERGDQWARGTSSSCVSPSCSCAAQVRMLPGHGVHSVSHLVKTLSPKEVSRGTLPEINNFEKKTCLWLSSHTIGMCTFVSVTREASNLWFHSFHLLIHLKESFLPHSLCLTYCWRCTTEFFNSLV